MKLPKSLLEEIYSQLEKRQFPKVSLKKHSIDNIVKVKNGYILGDKKIIKDSSNVAHIRSLTQLTWIASVAQKLIEEDKTCTLRDLYYMIVPEEILPKKIVEENKGQAETNKSVMELETYLETPREEFNIFPEERSDIFGDLTIEYTSPIEYKGIQVNLTQNPDGTVIGPRLAKSKLIKTSADKILVIEKGAIFTRCLEEKTWKHFNSILIHTAGQPPRATRIFIRRLHEEFNIPVYILTDGDPWGLAIAVTIKYGSISSAHIENMATVNAKWLGVWASDIIKYDLPSIKFDDKDVSRLNSLEKDPRCKEDSLFSKEIMEFKKINKKCEIEAGSKYSLEWIVTEYLKEKLENLH